DQRARQIADLIPLGQPILLGHHSQRRAERDQERIVRHTAKAAEGYRQAAETARRAAAVGQDAAYSATPQVTARRIERTEAELRRIDRELHGSTRQFRTAAGEVYRVEVQEPATGDRRERLLARRAQLVSQLAYDRAQLKAAEAVGRYV